MTIDEWRDLVVSSCEYLTARNDELTRTFRIGSYKRWDWSMDTGELVFSDAGVPIVVAKIQFVGSISKIGGTWCWSWANVTIDDRVKSRILEVRRYGKERGIDKLTTPCWDADEVDGWEMTSISARLLGAKGAYRTPGDRRTFMYLIMTDVRWNLTLAQPR